MVTIFKAQLRIIASYWYKYSMEVKTAFIFSLGKLIFNDLVSVKT